MNAPTQWTVCCDAGGAFGAVSSCYPLKCTVPSLTLSFPRAFSSSLRRLPSCSIEGYSVGGCSPPEISETLTLCESKADPRWKRATEGRRPKNRSWMGFTRISRAGIPKRPLPNCQAGPTASSTPRCRGVGTPSWTGPLTTSLRGLWVSGYLPRAMADRAQGRRPENRQSDHGG